MAQSQGQGLFCRIATMKYTPNSVQKRAQIGVGDAMGGHSIAVDQRLSLSVNVISMLTRTGTAAPSF